MRIGIFPNKEKKASKEILQRMINFFAQVEADIFIPADSAALFECEQFSTRNIREEGLDVGISIGGDGTLLGVCRKLAPFNIPVCGINIGHLGFLTDIEVGELESKLQKIIDGKYEIEERLMLAGYIKKDKLLKLAGYAVNDVVLTGMQAKMIGLELQLDSYKVADYKADGLIIATATGSTAYSLSAGGPIVNPKVKVIVVTPICPHTFYVRPMIADGSEKVNIKIKNAPESVRLTFDGSDSHLISEEEEVIICQAPFAARIVKFNDKNYYKILLSKLIGSSANANNK